MQVLAESQTLTYEKCPDDIVAMARIGVHGNPGQHCRKQLEQLFPKALKSPKPFVVKLPILKKLAGQGEWVSCFHKVSFFLQK